MRKLLTFLIALAVLVVVNLSVPASAQYGCKSFGRQGGTGCNSIIPPSFQGPGDIVSGAYGWWGMRAYTLAKAGTKIANICNAADASCADVNSLANGQFDVATAQGAPLNCGGAGGTCTIKTLYEQTGNLNCGASICNLTNTTVATRPTLVFNCIGTAPCLSFVGASSQQLLTAAAAVTAAQPLTVSYVARRTGATTAFGDVFVVGGGSLQAGYSNAVNTLLSFAGTVTTSAASDAAYHAAQDVISSSVPDIYIDGTGGCGGTCSSPGAGTLTASLIGMGNAAGGNACTCNVLEMGLWASAFSAPNKATMNSNQHGTSGYNF
jgi:hypothetical protein